METCNFEGIFKGKDGVICNLNVKCNGFIQAFFLLTSETIRCGSHYQLYSITDENGNMRMCDDIINMVSCFLNSYYI